jgi:hypothetical protein
VPTPFYVAGLPDSDDFIAGHRTQMLGKAQVVAGEILVDKKVFHGQSKTPMRFMLWLTDNAIVPRFCKNAC